MVVPHPSHSEAAPWLREDGPFPNRRFRLRFFSTGQVSAPEIGNRSGPRVPDPFFRSTRPRGSLRARVSVPSRWLPGAHSQEAAGTSSAFLARMALPVRHGQYQGLRPPRDADEAAPAGSADCRWRRMKESKSGPRILTAMLTNRKRR